MGSDAELNPAEARALAGMRTACHSHTASLGLSRSRLGRLKRLGLIDNGPEGSSTGGYRGRYWRITPEGVAALRRITNAQEERNNEVMRYTKGASDAR